MSRPRQVIAKRMVESLQTSAQLTTVVEVDVTNIARLRDRAKAAFEAREGVKLTFLPFFAQATVEALKIHPKLNSVINAETQEVTYHAAEHLGIAVDTERGLMVPVIHGAGDLNIGGLARKIADLAARTRGGQVGPDELSGGTFTLTNTGSRGALFDTPIINLPQVGILGVGSVVKRAVVVEDPALGEVIAVRSMVYLALTYDHRLVDGADAARFLVTVKNRLEEGAFEADLGLFLTAGAAMKVAITGSSGLIGTALTASLQADGHQVVRLVRRPPRPRADEHRDRWDPRAADAGNPVLTGVSACVHLAGAGVGDHRWTAAYKAEIRSSRVLATRALATALAGLSPRPLTFISGSAMGWYGDTGGAGSPRTRPRARPSCPGWWPTGRPPPRRPATPASASPTCAAASCSAPGGGVLGRLALPARLGVLPRFGDGRQVMSWISLTDEVRAIRFLLDGPARPTAAARITSPRLTRSPTRS